jgi:hypothetical protein
VAIASHAGHEVDTQGDAFFVAFASAKQAVLCAVAVQRALAGHQWPSGVSVRVRVGIHTGQATPVEGVYTGLAVHRAAGPWCSTGRHWPLPCSARSGSAARHRTDEQGQRSHDTRSSLSRPGASSGTQ